MEGVGWILNILTECLSQVMMARLVPSGKNLRFASVWVREALNSSVFVGVGCALGCGIQSFPFEFLGEVGRKSVVV
jgi:hypothetical protein